MQKKKVVQLQKQFDLRVSMLKSISVSFSSRIVLLVSHDNLLIMSTDFGFIIKRIKKQASIKSAWLSGNGKYILSHFSDNSLRVFYAKTGKEVAHLIGVPNQARNFQICDNGNKVVGASNQVIAVWGVKNSQLTLSCRNWKNINCFAPNKKGSRIAIGTYNGSIFIVRQLGDNKCAQIEFNILKKCVMNIAWQDDILIAIDYDRSILVFSTTSSPDTLNKEQSCGYKQYKISFTPKDICVVNNIFYITQQKGGIHWFEEGILMGLENSEWQVCKGTETKTMFYYTEKGYLKFWTLVYK